MSDLDELSEPIRLVDYDPDWPRRFEQEAEKIARALDTKALLIEHVGSTSVRGLIAKPIIDIVLAVRDSAEEAQYASALQEAGYCLHIREPEWYEHRMFKNRASDVNLHVFAAGCPEIDRMLMLRNWLRTSGRDRELYTQTKRVLATREWRCVQDYADAKTSVIEEIMSRARGCDEGISLTPDAACEQGQPASPGAQASRTRGD